VCCLKLPADETVCSEAQSGASQDTKSTTVSPVEKADADKDFNHAVLPPDNSSKDLEVWPDSLSESFSEILDPGDTQVIYVREAVSVWPSRRVSIEGRLTLIKQHDVMFLAWLPYTLGTLNNDGTFSALPESRLGRAGSQYSDRTMYAVHPIPLSEIKAITKHIPTLGWHYLCVVLVSGLTLPPLYFNNGGVRAFIGALKQHAVLMKTTEDPNTYLVNDLGDPLQRSLTSLELADVLLGNPRPGAPVAWGPQSCDAAASWCTGDRLGAGPQPPGAGAGLSSMSMHIIDQFSRVARLARDTTSSLFVGADGLEPLTEAEDTAATGRAMRPWRDGIQEPPWRLSRGSAGAGGFAAPTSDPTQRPQADAGSEAVTGVGSFELVDQQIDLPTAARQRIRPPPLGLEEWSAFLDAEGRLLNEAGFRQRVFQSGLSPALRKEAWKFLLQLYPSSSTASERAGLASARSREYEVLKRQWSTISPKQAASFSKWRERLSRVEKDVHRTDRSHAYFSGDSADDHMRQLRAVLLTYCMYNFDLGYCQGMSDLAAPLLAVMHSEADAFWCFVALMERMQSNFHTDQTGMHKQLRALERLVALLDPQLSAFLQERDCLNFFFCFRWILIHFKREFEFDQVLRLWEALWSRHLSEHFHLYVCVAVLEQQRRVIMREEMDFDAILTLCINLSYNIDLDSVLRDAEALCLYAGPEGREILDGLP